MRSMILDLPYTRNVLTRPLVPFEGYKWAISKLWRKGEEFNFESKVTQGKLFTSY
jgi:hypothetical protein